MIRKSFFVYLSVKVTFVILTSVAGLSFGPVFTFPILFTTSIPSITSPKIACFPSSQGVAARVIKKCHVPVYGTLFAIESIHYLECLKPVVTSF